MVKDSASRRRRRTAAMAQAYRDSHEVMSICLSLGVMVGGGYWLDLRFGLLPLFTITGVILGFVAAGFSLRRLLERLDKRPQQERASSSDSNDQDAT
ncbi:MAG: AtpZ/AtpI family protein [Fuerstiella sp.]|nr:AtpZ/AtpI family protein [Fuerstiella sp.]